MKQKLPYKVIQVPMDTTLLGQLDEAAGRVAETRAAYIREACRRRLQGEEARELDRRYVAGYRRKPEDHGWAKLGAKFLARRLGRDRW